MSPAKDYCWDANKVYSVGMQVHFGKVIFVCKAGSSTKQAFTVPVGHWVKTNNKK